MTAVLSLVPFHPVSGSLLAETVNTAGNGTIQSAVAITTLFDNPIVSAVVAGLIVAVICAVTRTVATRNKDFEQQFLRVKPASKISPEDFDFGKDTFSVGKDKKPYYLERKSSNGSETLEECISKRVTDTQSQRNDILIMGKPDSGKTRMAYEVIRNLKGHYILLIPKTGIYDTSNLRLPFYLRSYIPLCQKPKFILFLDDLQKYCASTSLDDLISKLQNRFPVTIIATVREGDECTKAVGNELFGNSNRFSALLSDDTCIHIPDVSDEEASTIAHETGKPIPEGFEAIRTVGAILSGWNKLKESYIKKVQSSADNTAKNAHKIMIANKALYDLGLSNTDPERVNTVLSEIYGIQLDKSEITASENLLCFNHIIAWDTATGEWLAGGKILEFLVLDALKETTLLNHIDHIFMQLQEKHDSFALLQCGARFYSRDLPDISYQALSHATQIPNLPFLFQATLYFALGTVLGELATRRYPANAEDGLNLFNQAFAKYEKAVKIKPDKHEAWNNWGTALVNLAGYQYATDAKEGIDLFNQAFAKYEKVVKIKPDSYVVWGNWGSALGDLAKYRYPVDTEGGIDLFNQAFAKYEEAVKIKPDICEAWTNWGITLGDLATCRYSVDTEGYSADAEEVISLFNQAFAKYEAVVKIKPESYEAWYNWGTDLGNLAEYRYTANAEEGIDLFNQTFAKYEEAVKIKPDSYETWYNWGNALGYLATCQYPADAEEGISLFNQAFAKCEKAVKIEPDGYEAWYNWGTYLGNLAIYRYAADAEEGIDLFNQAFAKYEEAVKIKPDSYEAWTNWGNALGYLATCQYPVDAEEGISLFNQAFAKYEEAVKIKPDICEAWYNWGNALGYLAAGQYPADAEEGIDLFNQAFAKYEEVMKIEPDYYGAWNNWYITLKKYESIISPEHEPSQRFLTEETNRFERKYDSTDRNSVN